MDKGSLTLREVADDLGVAYETARQLCFGAAGEPLPFLRTSARAHARWIIPADAYREWKERRVEASTAPYRRSRPNVTALAERGRVAR